jgi:hypothetical protein
MMRATGNLLCGTLLLFVVACGGGDENSNPGTGGSGSGAQGGATQAKGGETQGGGTQAEGGSSNSTGPDTARFANAKQPPKCEARAAETLYQHTTKVHAVMVTKTSLLFAATDGLFSMPKDASKPPIKVFDGVTTEVANANNDVYYSKGLTTYLVNPTILENGGSPKTVSGGPELSGDGTRVYAWETQYICGDGSYQSTVYVYDSEGKSEKVKIPCIFEAAGYDGVVYAIDWQDKKHHRLMRGTPNNEAQTLAQDDQFTGFVAATSKHAYASVSPMLTTDYLVRVPVTGGDLEILSGPHTFNSLVSNGRSVFFSDVQNHCVYSFNGDSNELTAFAKAALVEGMAFDNDYVYFAGFEGAIQRAKAP